MAGQSLKQLILNEIDSHPRGYAEELAKISGCYSSGSNLKKVLTSQNKEFDKLNGLLNIVRHLFGEDEQKIMEQYSKEIDPNNKLARHMLEYLSCNRLLDSMRDLLDRMLTCNNKESKEWAEIYCLQYEWQTNYHNIKIDDHLKKIKSIRTNIKEMDVYLRLLKIYVFYYKDKHNQAYEIAQELIIDIDDISNDYIRGIYNAKLSEVLSYIELWVLNNPQEARKHANNVIDARIGKTYEAYALYTIGLTYFYTSYETALTYLNKSVELYKSIDRNLAAKDVEEYIEKLNVFWRKSTEQESFISTCNELLYRVNNGENVEVKLENANLDEPYYFYIKGLNNNNNDDLMESLIIFIDRGDTFWANQVKIDLIKRGGNERVISRVMNINRA